MCGTLKKMGLNLNNARQSKALADTWQVFPYSKMGI